MAPTETEARVSAEVASRAVIRKFIFDAVCAVMRHGVEVKENISGPGPGQLSCSGYEFTFCGVRIRTNVDGSEVFTKRNIFDGERELEFLEPAQKDALFKACVQAIKEQADERRRLRRDEAECAQERERLRREREYAQLALTVGAHLAPAPDALEQDLLARMRRKRKKKHSGGEA